jgi:hypothetical protein
MSPDDPRHGTSAGYNAHYKTDLDPCEPCKAAKARYEKRRRHDTHLGAARTVPSLGCQRRVRALQRLGWSLSAIAQEAGWNSPQALQYVMRSNSIYRESRDRICEVFERLAMKIPPATSGSIRARNRAIRNGYAPPLAWDDIDDPDERPKLGVHRKRDTLAEYRWLLDGGVSHFSAVQQLGISEAAVLRAIEREKEAA